MPPRAVRARLPVVLVVRLVPVLVARRVRVVRARVPFSRGVADPAPRHRRLAVALVAELQGDVLDGGWFGIARARRRRAGRARGIRRADSLRLERQVDLRGVRVRLSHVDWRQIPRDHVRPSGGGVDGLDIGRLAGFPRLRRRVSRRLLLLLPRHPVTVARGNAGPPKGRPEKSLRVEKKSE